MAPLVLNSGTPSAKWNSTDEAAVVVAHRVGLGEYVHMFAQGSDIKECHCSEILFRLWGASEAEGKLMPNPLMERLLKSVGQRVFVSYYCDFANPAMSTADLVDLLAAEGFTEKACKSRATHARRIFAEGLNTEALRFIAASTRGGNEKTAKMASELLTQVQKEADEASRLVPPTQQGIAVGEVQEDHVVVSIMPLTSADIDEARLSEITDSTVLARITQVIPAAADAVVRTSANNTLKSMEVYKAVLPAGESLAKSRTMPDAFRGFGRAGSEFNSKFSSHANFVRVDPSAKVAFAVALDSAMNVASLVVGQYYMSQVSSRLEALNEGVRSLADFNEAELKSRIMSLISHVDGISQFSSQILEDDALRDRKQQTLDNLSLVATDLLGQVNGMIEAKTAKSPKPNPNLNDYQKRIGEVTVLLRYQQALLVVLAEISELTYLLGKGAVPSEMSHLQLRRYHQHCVQTDTRLGKWHSRQVKRLDIDLANERKNETGRYIAASVVLLGLAVAARKTPFRYQRESAIRRCRRASPAKYARS